MRRKVVTDYTFDRERFGELIVKACGNRSQTEFSEDAGISYAYLNKYINGRRNIAPTIDTIKKIAEVTKLVTYEELLRAAGYDAAKYKKGWKIGREWKDFLQPVFIGIANSSYEWRIESSGYKDNEPFEIIIERGEVSRWFFVPVTKLDITKDEIQNFLMSQPKFIPGSKISFITDNDEVFELLKKMEFQLFSIYISAIRVDDSEIIEETSIKTSISTDLTIVNEDSVHPLSLGR